MSTRPFADDALNLISALLDAPERAVELLRSLVAHPSAEVRMRALEALIDVERPETVTIAAQALSDPDATVRVAAIELLTAQGREEHTQTIWRLAVSDPDPHVREQALLNLSALNGPLDVDELVELAKNTTGAHQVAAANLLCARGHREWLLPLLEGLYDPDYLTRAMTLTVLEDRIESQERPFVRRLLVERHTAEDLPAVRALIETLVGEWSEG